MPAIFAEAIKGEARVHFGEMMVSNFGGVGGLRSELGLKAEGDAREVVGIFLETEVLFEDPEEVSGETAFFEKALPGGQCVFVGWALVLASGFHID